MFVSSRARLEQMTEAYIVKYGERAKGRYAVELHVCVFVCVCVCVCVWLFMFLTVVMCS